MILTKAIITTDETQAKLICKKYSLVGNDSSEFNIYEGTRLSDENEEEKIVLLFSGNTKDKIREAMKYLFENYDINKLVNIGTAKLISDVDIKAGDIFIPNTFITLDEKEPLFLNYAVGENYDLTKFGLILNGVCLSLEGKELPSDMGSDFIADIVDNEAYNILFIAKAEDKLDKCVVLKATASEDSRDEAINNSIQIVDFIL